MIEIKTLKQPMVGQLGGDDAELADHLNDGWRILNLSIVGATDDIPTQRIITLQRENAQAAIEPKDVIEPERAYAIGSAIDDVEREIGHELAMELQGVFGEIADQLRIKKILKRFYLRVIDIDLMAKSAAD